MSSGVWSAYSRRRCDTEVRWPAMYLYSNVKWSGSEFYDDGIISTRGRADLGLIQVAL